MWEICDGRAVHNSRVTRSQLKPKWKERSSEAIQMKTSPDYKPRPRQPVFLSSSNFLPYQRILTVRYVERVQSWEPEGEAQRQPQSPQITVGTQVNICTLSVFASESCCADSPVTSEEPIIKQIFDRDLVTWGKY
ncbi:hypothetical protein NA56DRAFT_749317 [Hyaloscypha hepaticicola]|uniref:Uncharacterized protein n=1 Tax=Hyaloscypha hepaticicola TaxID=2082293 RepID=A0A2J6Q3N6_9HELO|nr:hypothetical protein NA56DRAFT_749317 [Hyaloscypha hepaticicola]